MRRPHFVEGPTRRTRTRFLYQVAAPLLLISAGCASRQQFVYGYTPPNGAVGVVFSVDGAGGYHAPSENLQRVMCEQGVPLHLEVFRWSHGPGEIIADQTDFDHLVAQGHRLAAQIESYRRNRPGHQIYVVAHSAGSAVALGAAELLPPDSLTRVVLLAPSMSTDYDVSRALASAREGMDVFFSRRDVGYLALAVGVLGNADRGWSPAAGRVGFESPAMAVYVNRLRQHPWQPEYAALGNNGGHYGGYQPAFLKEKVVPLLVNGSSTRAPSPAVTLDNPFVRTQNDFH